MTTLVVGVGNEDRGDDGLGPLAARLLAQSWAAGPPAGVEVITWTGDPMGLLDRLAGVDRLVLIDAVVSGGEPGTTRRFGADAPFAETAGASTHNFKLAAALALGRALGRLPERVEVWGIEAAEFGHGAPLTLAVAEAVLALVPRLSAEVSGDYPAER